MSQKQVFHVSFGLLMLPLFVVLGIDISAIGIKTILSPLFSSKTVAIAVPAQHVKSAGNIVIQQENKANVTKKTSTSSSPKPEKTRAVMTSLAVPIGGQQKQTPTSVNVQKAGNEKKDTRRISQTVAPVQIKPTVVAAKPLPEKKTARTWTVQAGAFSSEASANQLKGKISSAGYNVSIVKAGTEKPLYRVIVVAGESREAANATLKKLKSIGIEGYILGRP